MVPKKKGKMTARTPEPEVSPCGPDEPRQLVATKFVGAEEVLGRKAPEDVVEILVIWRVRADDRSKDRHHDQANGEHRAGNKASCCAGRDTRRPIRSATLRRLLAEPQPGSGQLSSQADPWVEAGGQQVRDEVDDYDAGAEDERDGLHDREVAVQDRAQQQRSETVEVEDLFDNDGRADEVGDVESEERHRRHEGVAGDVANKTRTVL